MKKDDILNKAIEVIKQTHIPSGPPKDLSDTTLEKLNQISSQFSEENFDKQIVSNKRFILNNLLRIAAAVILSLSIGYAAGRFSAPKQIDMEQLRSELEPAIREKLLKDVQFELASNYFQIKQELTGQYLQDLRQVALEILNASGSITNQLLKEQIQPIAAAQYQDRQWITAELNQTRQNVAVIARFLTSTDIDNPNESGNQNINYQGENHENLNQNY